MLSALAWLRPLATQLVRFGSKLWSRKPSSATSQCRIKFGHAFPHPKDAAADPVAEAYELLRGASSIGPRDPHDSSSVWKAEQLLRIDRTKRPVYVFIGHLHPELGLVGVIVARRWFDREPHGVTRCDTGGLIGAMGGFRHLHASEASAALEQLSHLASTPWLKHLEQEVVGAFGGAREYVRGREPNPACFSDARRKCIDAERNEKLLLDRRLWTWEARGFAPISVDDVDAVAIAPTAAKQLLPLLENEPPPSHVKLLIGSVSPMGVHYFQEEEVLNAFEENSP